MNHYLPRAESEFVKASGGTEFLKGLVRKAMEGNEPQVDVRAVAPRPSAAPLGPPRLKKPVRCPACGKWS
jgi:hypothetical protein